MVCMNCGCVLPDDREICSHCGAVVKIRPGDSQTDEASLEELRRVSRMMKARREEIPAEEQDPEPEATAEESVPGSETPEDAGSEADAGEEAAAEAEEPGPAPAEQESAPADRTDRAPQKSGASASAGILSVLTAPFAEAMRRRKEDRDHDLRRRERSRTRRKRTNSEKYTVTLVILVMMALCVLFYLLGQRGRSRGTGAENVQTQQNAVPSAGDGAGESTEEETEEQTGSGGTEDDGT